MLHKAPSRLRFYSRRIMVCAWVFLIHCNGDTLQAVVVSTGSFSVAFRLLLLHSRHAPRAAFFFCRASLQSSSCCQHQGQRRRKTTAQNCPFLPALISFHDRAPCLLLCLLRFVSHWSPPVSLKGRSFFLIPILTAFVSSFLALLCLLCLCLLCLSPLSLVIVSVFFVPLLRLPPSLSLCFVSVLCLCSLRVSLSPSFSAL